MSSRKHSSAITYLSRSKTVRVLTALFCRISLPSSSASFPHVSLEADPNSYISSWRPKIPFTLLFGVATSVELLQARLLKSACQHLYGAQFDVVQTGTILEQIFKPTIAATDAALTLGPNLLQSLVDRQQDQVASIQTFVASIKVRTSPSQ